MDGRAQLLQVLDQKEQTDLQHRTQWSEGLYLLSAKWADPPHGSGRGARGQLQKCGGRHEAEI